jgi:hypothetical protein
VQASPVLPYLFASAGPLTGIFEEIATSIGSGLVVGSFAVGLGSFIWTGSRRRSEGLALIGGYVGGLAATASLAIDTLAKRFV